MAELRRWQESALQAWRKAGDRGIASVVTGGGKTIFALACAKAIQPITVLVVVPTQALLDQWWEEVSCYFDLDLDEVHVITGRRKIRSGTFNLAVLNTAASLGRKASIDHLLLIVDECHKAASEKYRSVFQVRRSATLGLSATPARQYDKGLDDVLIPEIGPIIYEYTYKQALADGVIVPFRLVNVIFDLEPECREQFEKLTRSIAISVRRYGDDAPETVALLLKRARTVNLSLSRIELAARIVAMHPGRRAIVFHEDIAACEVLKEVMSSIGISCEVYHSGKGVRERAMILSAFRTGKFDVLVTCRALDEGFNVPEAELGVIAASTATQRQRIQRLGRLVRPSPGKESAVIYTLAATNSEILRLQQEEEGLRDVASIEWGKA
ncbi:MAG: DEAD/DEAH box helicase [Pirellulaceae bacterium]